MNEQEGTGNDFEPEITVFACIYCAYMAADTAGALRIRYPANVKLIKLPCTGKTDARYLLEAFEQGADGVCVVGCPMGNCHHVHEWGIPRTCWMRSGWAATGWRCTLSPAGWG